MKAIVTGASSGIGKEIAKILSEKGYYIILVARRKDLLDALIPELKNGGEVFVADLSCENACKGLYETYKDADVDILVNNAGFGVHGNFSVTDLEKDLSMLKTNILGLHTLTKLFLPKMLKRNKGYILNIASLAAFMSGPLMSAYYASKAYVLRLSRGISKEIKGTGVKISVLCPGPVDTEFNNVAGVKFAIKPLSANKVANIAVKGMFNGKFLILPGIITKLSAFVSKFLPDCFLSECSYQIQKKKV